MNELKSKILEVLAKSDLSDTDKLAILDGLAEEFEDRIWEADPENITDSGEDRDDD